MRFRPHAEYSIIRTDGTGKRLLVIPQLQFAVDVALSPSGELLALSGASNSIPGDSTSRTITVYEVASGQVSRTITLDEQVVYVTWSPDARFLAYTPFLEGQDPFDIAIVELSTGAREIVLDVPGHPWYFSWANEPPSQ